MVLTKEQQALLDGEKGETMSKVMKTLVMYGEALRRRAYGSRYKQVWAYSYQLRNRGYEADI